MTAIIEVLGLGKQYRLGKLGATTFREECQELWKNLTRHRNKRDYGDEREEAESSKVLWALKDVSFSVEPGKVVGIIGMNGAGKSTLLKLLSRITEPTEGEIAIRGKLASLLEVGTGFHPELTGRENVYLNGAILGMQRWEVTEKFERIVNFAEIGRFIDTPVKRYSSGMYVRLAFSVAAHLEPEIMIVDEVLAVGDFAFQAKCIERMHKLTRGGKTILLVSHNLYTLQTLCETGLLLANGRLIAQGAMHRVISEFRKVASSSEVKAAEKLTSEAQSEVIVDGIFLNGSGARLIESQEECQLTVECEMRVKTPCVIHVGCSIKSSEGVYVCGLSTFVEALPRFYERGKHRVGIQIRNVNLCSGGYRVAFAVMNRDGVATYFSNDAIAELVFVRTFQFDGTIGLGHQWIRGCG